MEFSLKPLNELGMHGYGVPEEFEYVEPVPTFEETMSAAWETHSVWHNVKKGTGLRLPRLSVEEQEAYTTGDFRPLTYLEEVMPDLHPDHLGVFAGLKSQAQVDWKLGRLQEELRNREILDRSPFLRSFIAETLTEFTSPYDLALVGFKLPKTALKMAGRLAGEAFGATAATELTLHAFQDTRTAEESALYLIGGTGIGAVAGGVLGRRVVSDTVLDPQVYRNEGVSTVRNNSQIVGDLPEAPRTARMDMSETTVADPSVGAAFVADDVPMSRREEIYNDDTLVVKNADGSIDEAATADNRFLALSEESGKAHGAKAETAIKAAGGGVAHQVIPEVRMIVSKDPIIRSLANNLFNHNLWTQNRIDGTYTPNLEVHITSAMQRQQHTVLPTYKDAYKNYVKETEQGEVMTEIEFQREIQTAITRGYTHDNPHVMGVANAIRGVSDNIEKRLMAQNLLPDPRKVAREEMDAELQALVDSHQKTIKELGQKKKKKEFIKARKSDIKAIKSDPNLTQFQKAEIIAGLKKQMDDYDPATFQEKYKAYVEEEVEAKRAELEEDFARREADGEFDRYKPLGDEAWFPRSYNANWWSREFSDIRDVLMPGLRQHAEADIKKAQLVIEEKFQGQIDDLERSLADMTPKRRENALAKIERLTEKKYLKMQEVEDRWVRKTETHLRNMRDEIAFDKPQIGTSYIGMGVSKTADGNLQVVRPRTFDISTEYLMRVAPDALETDIIGSYLKNVGRLERQLQTMEDIRFGDPTLNNYVTALQARYEARVRKANREMKPADAKEFQKELYTEYLANKKEIQDTAFRLNGIKNTQAREMTRAITDGAKMFAGVTRLGRMLFSQLPEFFAPINTVGIRGMIGHAVDTVFNSKEMRSLKDWERADYGIGTESAAGMRIAEQGEYDYTMSAGFEKAKDLTDITVDKLFLGGIWTRHARLAAGTMVQSKIGRFALKGSLSKKDKLDLQRIGITDEIWDVVRKEVREHHNKVGFGGTVDMQLPKWGNQEVAERIATAIHSEADNIILKPGMGSRPFLADGAVASLLLQFKTFPLTATSRYWMTGVQRMSMGDMRPAMQFTMMSTAAAIATALRQETLPEDKQREFSMQDYIREGILMGGATGIMMDANAVIGAATNGSLDAYRLIGFDPEVMTRFRGSQRVLGGVFGPSVQTAQDFIKVVSGLADLVENGEIGRGELGAMRRMLPLNNWAPIALPVSIGQSKLFDAIGERQ